MTKKLRLGCSLQGEEDGKKVNNLLEMNRGEGANDVLLLLETVCE